jgi:long-chain fatty acid transport protein
VNPAGLATGGKTFGAGVIPIFGSGTFTSDSGQVTSLTTLKTPPFHTYLGWNLNDRTTIGVGGYTPYGLGLKWPLDFSGRFVSFESRLQTFYIQPTAAYAINDHLSIGGGVTLALSTVELNRREDLARVPLGTVPGLTFGALVDSQTDFESSTFSAKRQKGVGFNVGVLLKGSDRVRFGAKYLSRVSVSYDGTATFTPVAGTFRVTKPNPLGLPVGTPLDSSVSQVQAALQNQAISTKLTMPAQFGAGISVHASDRLLVMADYQWVGWSAFKTVTLDFSLAVPADESLAQNYRDTNALLLGAEYAIRTAVRLRAGYFHNPAAAPDESVTPLLPESSRNHFSGGLGWNLGGATLDVAYQYVHHADRPGRTMNPPAGTAPTTSLNDGVYRESSHLLGITVSRHW